MRSFPYRTRALVAILASPLALVAFASPGGRVAVFLEDLPLIGSLGGNTFARTCPAGNVLAGIRFRSGMVLDGIGIRCRPIRSDGTLGSAFDSGSMAGGNGGTAGSATCPGNAVVASQRGSSQAGVGIGTLHFFCHEWFPASQTWGGSSIMTLSVKSISVLLPALVTSTCGRGTQPARGIYGRHGSVVDAVGLRCLAP